MLQRIKRYLPQEDALYSVTEQEKLTLLQFPTDIRKNCANYSAHYRTSAQYTDWFQKTVRVKRDQNMFPDGSPLNKRKKLFCGFMSFVVGLNLMKIYFQRVSEIRKAQNFKEFYSRHFSGKFSPYVAAAFVGTPVTPNHLTALMVPSGIVGGIMLSFGTPLGFTIGSLLFVLLNILDAADGELARYTEQTSEFGDYLDRVAHYMTNVIMGLGLALLADWSHIIDSINVFGKFCHYRGRCNRGFIGDMRFARVHRQRKYPQV